MRTHPGRSNVCTYKFCSTHDWAFIDFEVVKMNVESEKNSSNSMRSYLKYELKSNESTLNGIVLIFLGGS